MSIKIYDTYRRQKVEFVPLNENQLKMYNCGPTVHDFAHIGNFRSYCFADLIRRWFEVNGYDVKQVMNITDIDDKTIRKSREQGISLKDFTKKYIEAFFEDLEKLNILPAAIYPHATGHIKEMVGMIEELLENGNAYKADDGSYYFRVESFNDYGNLSGKRLEDLRLGERVSNDEYESKDDVRDFALWKAWEEDDGDVFWETEIGKGRPGWHIECSAMSLKHLGSEFDIHTGGVDNIFPHHENEIAQSRCAGDNHFARHWMHAEYLIVNGKKMSKSLGNFFTLRDLIEKGYSAREVRYVLTSTHYRSQLNFTFETLEAARNALSRIDEFKESWATYKDGGSSEEVAKAIKSASDAFDEAMNDDLNVARAFAAVFALIREVNGLAAKGLTTSGDLAALEAVWDRWDHALGLLTAPESDQVDEDSAWIEGKIAERKEARASKNWSLADQIRDEIAEKGYIIKDTPDGTTWKRK